jgi:hypothetical protein
VSNLMKLQVGDRVKLLPDPDLSEYFHNKIESVAVVPDEDDDEYWTTGDGQVYENAVGPFKREDLEFVTRPPKPKEGWPWDGGE